MWLIQPVIDIDCKLILKNDFDTVIRVMTNTQQQNDQKLSTLEPSLNNMMYSISLLMQ